jgi:hypothetical protein
MRLVSAWRSTTVLLGGRPANFWSLATKVAQVHACYAQRAQHPRPDDYCSGKDSPTSDATFFGCRFLTAVSRHPSASAYASHAWWDYGSLTADNKAFAVDKGAIERALRHSPPEACVCCPPSPGTRPATTSTRCPSVSTWAEPFNLPIRRQPGQAAPGISQAAASAASSRL